MCGLTKEVTRASLDALAPLGHGKVEPNGTTAVTSFGKTGWHEYAKPRDVPVLVGEWLQSLAGFCRNPLVRYDGHSDVPEVQDASLDACTDVHLGFAAIHPYADGNGLMARLLANIPVLRAGLPPLFVSAERRRDYLALMGDYSLGAGQIQPGEGLVRSGAEREALRAFFAGQWLGTRKLVAEFHKRQAAP